MKKVKTVFVVVLFMGLTSISLFAQRDYHGSSFVEYDNSPDTSKVLPSVIWAPASGGGVWYTEVQIYAPTSGTEVVCFFNYGDAYRGELIWISTMADQCYKTTNILGVMDGLDPDPGFDYYGRSGSLAFYANGNPIQVMARTWHSGGYAKTICGLNYVMANTAGSDRGLMIMNVMQSASFRTSITLYNSGDPCTAYIYIIQNDGVVIGYIEKSLGTFGYRAFNVFAEAGLTGTYDNCWVLVYSSAGGYIFCSGATANNSTNDPAYHVAMQDN